MDRYAMEKRLERAFEKGAKASVLRVLVSMEHYSAERVLAWPGEELGDLGAIRGRFDLERAIESKMEGWIAAISSAPVKWSSRASPICRATLNMRRKESLDGWSLAGETLQGTYEGSRVAEATERVVLELDSRYGCSIRGERNDLADLDEKGSGWARGFGRRALGGAALDDFAQVLESMACKKELSADMGDRDRKRRLSEPWPEKSLKSLKSPRL